MVRTAMATAPARKGTPDPQEELEKKLSSIGLKEKALNSKDLAAELGLPYAELRGLPIDPEALRQLTEEEARAAGAALVQVKGPVAVLVVVDPRDPATLAIIERLRQKYPQLKVVVTSAETMAVVLARYETVKTVEVFEIGAITVDDKVLTQAQERVGYGAICIVSYGRASVFQKKVSWQGLSRCLYQIVTLH